MFVQSLFLACSIFAANPNTALDFEVVEDLPNTRTGYKAETVKTVTIINDDGRYQFSIYHLSEGNPEDAVHGVYVYSRATGMLQVAHVDRNGVEPLNGSDKEGFWAEFAKANDLSVEVSSFAGKMGESRMYDLYVKGLKVNRVRLIPDLCLTMLCPEDNPDCCKPFVTVDTFDCKYNPRCNVADIIDRIWEVCYWIDIERAFAKDLFHQIEVDVTRGTTLAQFK
ncbi:hypothetical protein [Acanthopleuribacter pedis]|uniref:Uncharacterized protein n=1 Tax=Acanthopleuribacter pedis TaxID=442870 RepID=A0A8J7Q7S9_9BACT|nr:hypothetical protein [Acanthopleuribacter pedis]MBO1322312.1 hypothetical protein [Acanthopleuribacter pedis]